MLPYLEQRDLYSRFAFDEPLESPHNLTLVRSGRPAVYRCGASPIQLSAQLVPEELPACHFYAYLPALGQKLEHIADASGTPLVLETPAEAEFLYPWPLAPEYDIDRPRAARTNHAGWYPLVRVDGSAAGVRFEPTAGVNAGE